MTQDYTGYIITRGGTQQYLIRSKLEDPNEYLITDVDDASKFRSTCSARFIANRIQKGKWQVVDVPVSTDDSPELSNKHNTPPKLGRNNMLEKYQDQNIANVILVKGRDASELTEGEFFSLLNSMQKELDTLEALPNESTHVNNRITALRKDISDMVDLMDTMLAE